MWRNLILMLALFAQPTPPPLRAVWERPGIARIAWHDAGCLWKGDTFYKCYDTSGVLLLGSHGPLDGRMRPRAGDVFRFVRPDGAIEQSEIKSVLYFPVFRGRHNEAP